MTKIEYIKNAVSELLGNKFDGHDDKHVFRVYDTAMNFCHEIPSADVELVAAAALLHDCDDYKLFGEESARLLTNTKRILDNAGYDTEFKEKCANIVKTIGYSKRLSGITPDCIEGKIVSDADMCDATGLIGVIRCIEYRANHPDRNDPFFDPEYLPVEMDAIKYKETTYSPVVNHFFEKLFKLRDMALTEPGRKCLTTRHQTIVNFLETYFDEINAPKVWSDLLKKYM